jgi:hypothetical protein
VHALDPAELDVAGRTGPADPGERARRVQRRDRVGHGADNLPGTHHRQVVVRYQAERPAALPGPGVQHDRPGLGDRDRDRRHHPVQAVQRRDVQRRVDHVSEQCGPFGREPVRHADPLRPAGRHRVRDDPGHLAGCAAPHRRPVVAGPLLEQADQRLVGRSRPPGRRPVSSRYLGLPADVRRDRPDPRQHLLPAAHALSSPSPPARDRSAHQSRNVCRGGRGRSREEVQAASGPGRCRIRS